MKKLNLLFLAGIVGLTLTARSSDALAAEKTVSYYSVSSSTAYVKPQISNLGPIRLIVWNFVDNGVDLGDNSYVGFSHSNGGSLTFSSSSARNSQPRFGALVQGPDAINASQIDLLDSTGASIGNRVSGYSNCYLDPASGPLCSISSLMPTQLANAYRVNKMMWPGRYTVVVTYRDGSRKQSIVNVLAQ